MFTTIVIILAAVVAGAINAIAGGGTLISFPALMWAGRNAIVANATNCVALWPGSFSAAYGYRRDMKTLPHWLLLLVLPAILGASLGAWLLLRTPTKTFEHLVPILIFVATVLVAVQNVIAQKLGVVAKAHEKPTAGWVTFVFVFQFIVAVYGGYFGAGMGILMLAALGLIGLTDIHQMNGLKNLLAVCINGVAAIYFGINGAVAWRDGILMAVGAIAGGYFGAMAAQKVGRRTVRVAVIVIGFLMTIALAIKTWG
ncbi:MAG TPA: sulfite exporter TauE/SafE family protein [Thermoanaerobaculia bacterium]|nr:sulfite exporter TauE/SafE family protein [Thermoanaerobaculia bacterium]